MRLILLGPPGCGKGTQAELLCQRNQLEHISTGDLLRAAIRQGTTLGLRAKAFVESGQLVPDDLVNDLIAERFGRPDRPERFVMDGYPRTLAQAASFEQVLRQYSLNLTAVVLLSLSDEEIVRRVSRRWICPKPPGCGATYNTESSPPKKAVICDICGTTLVQRSDDQETTVRARLAIYHRDTAELIPYYASQGLLCEVSSQGGIEEVYNNVMKVLS
jgi:adenylate kinase